MLTNEQAMISQAQQFSLAYGTMKCMLPADIPAEARAAITEIEGHVRKMQSLATGEMPADSIPGSTTEEIPDGGPGQSAEPLQLTQEEAQAAMETEASAAISTAESLKEMDGMSPEAIDVVDAAVTRMEAAVPEAEV